MEMKKKWLVAIFLSKRDQNLTLWSGKVSYNVDVTDVAVPENTIFYFFSICDEVNLEVTQLKLSETQAIAWISQISELVHERKLYCCGQIKNKSLIIKGEDTSLIIDNFMQVVKENNFTVEIV